MLRFDFTIVHRPDRMMRDVDMLSRYNNWSVDFKKQATDETTDPEATSHDQDDPQAKSHSEPEGNRLTAMLLTSAQAPPSIQYCSPTLKGPAGAPHSALAQSVSTERTVWTINMPPSLEDGISNTGIQGHVLQRMSTQPVLREGERSPIDQAETSRRASNHDEINWLLA
jgi:hypothetical protein